MSEITFDVEEVGPWVALRNGGTWAPGRGTAVGLKVDDELVAGVLYEDYNKANVVCHISAEGNWSSNRRYLWMIFDYPFNQLGVNRITVVIASSNEKSIQLVEHMGFEKEATLTGAHPDGDLFIYKMSKDQCRWLTLKGQYNG